jgi:membrane protein DedA with SNARE-associated domain
VTVLGDLLHLIGRYGYLAVFFGVTLEGAGVPLPGETVLIAAGALVHRGVLDFGDTLFFGIFGAVVGSQIGYWIGCFGGRLFVLRWGRYALITPERLGHAEEFFARHGGSAVFIARFVVGLRVFGALVAATSSMPWGKFALYNFLGGSLARLLSVGKHKPGRALGRSSFTSLARCAGPRLAVAPGVPEGHARMRTGQSAPPRRPGVVKGVQCRGCAENFRVGRT